MNPRDFDDDDRCELVDMYDRVLACPTPGKRTDEMVARLGDAIQAQRAWASALEVSALRDGLAKAWKAEADRRRPARVLVPYNDEPITVPGEVGTKYVDPTSGVAYHQRELMELLTFEQVRAKIRAWRRAQAGYEPNIARAERLLELEAIAAAHGILATTPAEAAAALGVDLERWLLGDDQGLRDAS